MVEKTNIEKLRFIISHAKADSNLCAVAYRIIKDSRQEDRAVILEDFIKGFKNTPTDCTMELPTLISKDEEKKLMEKYGKYVDQKIDELIDESLEETDFYTRLAEFIVSDDMLQDGMAGAIAIFDCAVDRRFPYHFVDVSNVLTMEQERYQEIVAGIGEEKLEQIESALTYSFNQKTEKASLVLSLIDAREDYEERVIMMSRVLSYFDCEIIKLRIACISEGLKD